MEPQVSVYTGCPQRICEKNSKTFPVQNGKIPGQKNQKSTLKL